MEEEIQMYLDEANSDMDKSVQHVSNEISKIRAGKAMPTMLDGILVEYYGSMTPLNQVSSVTSPDARTLMVRPFEKTLIQEIEKSIMNGDLGLNPQNDGEQIIINIPTLTEERRVQLVKQAKHEGEQGKISIRNVRHDALHAIKSLKDDGISEDSIKRGEDKIQDYTNGHSKKIDDLIDHKEKEIMTV